MTTNDEATAGGMTADEHRAAAANDEACGDESFALAQEWEELGEPGMAARERDLGRHHRQSAARHLAAAESLDGR